MTLEPERLVSKDSIGGGMSFTEAIGSKGSQLLEHFFCDIFSHIIPGGAGDERVSHLFHFLFCPVVCHRPSETVCLGIAHSG